MNIKRYEAIGLVLKEHHFMPKEENGRNLTHFALERQSLMVIIDLNDLINPLPWSIFKQIIFLKMNIKRFQTIEILFKRGRFNAERRK
jgi:hypothetical protein